MASWSLTFNSRKRPLEQREGGPEHCRTRDLLTGEDVAAGERCMPTCSMDDALSSLAHRLLSSGQTAAAVVNGDSGTSMGLVTERDILHAYFVGAPRHCTVRDWLRGRQATRSGSTAADNIGAAQPARAASVAQPLEPLRSLLSSLAPASAFRGSDGGSLGRAVVSSSPPRLSGVFSHIDLARAKTQHGMERLIDALGEVSATTIAEIMEPFPDLPLCTPGSTMQHLVRSMLASVRPAALIADAHGVHGLVTPQDALWAFYQRVPLSEDAWESVRGRPGRSDLQRPPIPPDARLLNMASPMMTAAGQSACARMDSSEPLQHLEAVRPGSTDAVGARAGASTAERASPVCQLTSALASAAPAAAHTILEACEAPQQSTQVSRGAQTTVPSQHSNSRVPLRHHPVLVSDVVAQRGTAIAYLDETLLDCCDALVASGRSAAVLVDRDAGNTVQGVLTENDILQAFTESVPHEVAIDDWLRGTEARLPGFLMPALTMSPKTTLAEAAACMTSMALDMEARAFRFACHHLLVRTDSQACAETQFGRPAPQPSCAALNVRLLSSLDIALGMIKAAADECAGFNEAGAATAANLSVEKVMKPRSVVPICPLTASLVEAFHKIQDVQQNCALIVTGHSGRAEAMSVKGELREDAQSDVDTSRDAPKVTHHDILLERAQESYSDMKVEVEDSLKERRCAKQVPKGGEDCMPTTKRVGPSESTVCGAITTGDVLRAFSEHQSGKRVILDGWLRGLAQSPARRTISADACVSEAANTMAAHGVHHLLATDPMGGEVVGVLSALDIVIAIGKYYTSDLDAHPAQTSGSAQEAMKRERSLSPETLSTPASACN